MPDKCNEKEFKIISDNTTTIKPLEVKNDWNKEKSFEVLENFVNQASKASKNFKFLMKNINLKEWFDKNY